MSNIGNYNGSSSQGDSAMVINEKLRPIHAEAVGDYLHVVSAESSGYETNMGYTFTKKYHLFDANGAPVTGFGSFVSCATNQSETTHLPSKVRQLHGSHFIVQSLNGYHGFSSSVFGKQAYGITSHNLDGSINAGFTPIKPTNEMLPYVTEGLSSGKMIVGGNSVLAHGRYHAGIYRLNADGTVDNTFNVGGLGFDMVTTSALGSIRKQVTSILELSDGRIAVSHSCSEYNGINLNGTKCMILSADGAFISNLDTSALGSYMPISLLEFKGKLFVFFGYYTDNRVYDLTTYALDTTYALPNSFSSGYGVGVDKSGNDIFLSDFYSKCVKYIGGLTLDAAFPNISGTLRGVLSNGNLLFDVYAGSYVTKYEVYSPVDGTLIASRTVDHETSGSAYHHGFAKTATGFYTVLTRSTSTSETSIVGFNNDLSDIPGYQPIQLHWGNFIHNPEPKVLTIAGNKVIHTKECNQAIDEKRNPRKPYVIIKDNAIVAEPTPILTTGSIDDTCILDDGTLIAGDFRINDNIGIAKLDVNMVVDPSFVVSAVGGKVSSVNKLSTGDFLISGAFQSLNPDITRSNSLISTTSTNINATKLGDFDCIDMHKNADGTYYCVLLTTYSGAKLVRVNADLTIDNTFAPVIIQDDNEFNYVKCTSLADGTVVLYGEVAMINNVARKIVKVSGAGVVDDTFLYNPLVDVSGALFANGYLYVIESTGAFLRLNLDGSVNMTFDTLTPTFGTVSLGGLQGYTDMSDVDGKIYIAGSFSNFRYNGTIVNDLIRVGYDGTLDTTFSAGTGVYGFIHKVKPLGADKLVVAGEFQNYNTPINRGSAMIDATGVIEPLKFLFEADEYATNKNYRCIAKQSDGKYIVVGYFTKVWDGKTFVTKQHIARLNLDGTLDDTFNTGVTTAFNNFSNMSIHIDAQDRIYVFGAFTSYKGVSTGNSRIIRLLPNGAKDVTFSTGAGFNGLVSNIAVDASGIYCVGDFTTYKGVAAKRICKIDFDGNRITTFNVGTGFTAANSTTYYPNITVGGDGYVYVSGLISTIYKGVASASMVAKLDATTANRDNTLEVKIDGVVVNTLVDGASIWCVGNISSILDTDGKYYPSPGLVKYTTAGVVDKTLPNFVNTGFTTTTEAVTHNTTNGTTANIKDLGIIGSTILLSGTFGKIGSTIVKNLVLISTTGAIIKAYKNPYAFAGSDDSITVLDGKFFLSDLTVPFADSITNSNLVVIDKTTGTLDNSYDYSLIKSFNSSWLSNGIGILDVGVVGSDIYYPHNGEIYKFNTTATALDEPIIEYIADMVSTPKIYSINAVGGNLLVSGTIRYINTGFVKQLAIIDSLGVQVPGTLNGNDFDAAVLCVKEVLPGKIVCCGDFTMYGATQANRIIMLLVDGTIDTTFVYGTGFNGSVNCVTVLDTHKIVCEGTFTDYNGVATSGMIALNPDGTVYYNYSIASAEGLNYGSILYRNKQVLYGRKMLPASNTIANVSIGFMETTGKFELTRSASELNASTYGSIEHILQLANGKYIAATNYGYMIRLKADLTFDDTVTPKKVNSIIYGIALHTNGNIMVVGSFYSYDSVQGFDALGNPIAIDDYSTPIVNTCKGIIQIDSDLNLHELSIGTGGCSDDLQKVTVNSLGKIIVCRGGYGSDTFNSVSVGTMFVLNSDGSLDTGFDSSTINMKFDYNSVLTTRNGSIYVSDKTSTFRGLCIYDMVGTQTHKITMPTNEASSLFEPMSIAFDSVGNIVCVGYMYNAEGHICSFIKIDGTTLKPIVPIMVPYPSDYAYLTNVLCISDNLFVGGSNGIWFVDGNMNQLDDLIRRTGNPIKPVLINQAGQILFISDSDTTVIEIEPKHSYIRQCDMNGNILSSYRGR